MSVASSPEPLVLCLLHLGNLNLLDSDPRIETPQDTVIWASGASGYGPSGITLLLPLAVFEFLGRHTAQAPCGVQTNLHPMSQESQSALIPHVITHECLIQSSGKSSQRCHHPCWGWDAQGTELSLVALQ